MNSLKRTWKIVPLPTGGKDILFAQSGPKDWGSKDLTFETVYARFHFDGQNWITTQRRVDGLEEFDQGFPKRSLFPR